MILRRSFYNRNTLEVAKNLLGSVLVRQIGGKEIRAVITETEAYIGEDDLASHASKGRTPRTEIMYGDPGHAYVYMIYGMYYCMNIVTEKKGFPAAVLIRGVKIDSIDYKKTNGPGKLCRQLDIDIRLRGHDVTTGKKLWLEKGENVENENIIVSPRIGVAYAKRSAENPWRFTIGNIEKK